MKNARIADRWSHGQNNSRRGERPKNVTIDKIVTVAGALVEPRPPLAPST
jgi:hypothetical protein